MAWLFGSKKKHHKGSPTDSNEEDHPQDQPSEFVYVEKPDVPAAQDGECTSNSLYPSIPRIVPYPIPNDSSHNQQDAHPLSGVPFKLSKELQSMINNDFEIDKLRISEISLFIKRLDDMDLEYSFSVEENVITEMNNYKAE